MRFPEDVVSTFLRREIDRSSYSPDFHTPDGRPIITLGLDLLRANKELAVFDGGCGTGHALWDLYQQVSWRAGFPLNVDSLHFVGMNNEDFSGESQWAEVRKAIREKKIEYVVGDLGVDALPTGKFDIVTLYEVLIHNTSQDAQMILQRLQALLKPEGWLFANMYSEQLDALGKLPAGAHTYTKTQGDDKRIFLILRGSSAKTK